MTVSETPLYAPKAETQNGRNAPARLSFASGELDDRFVNP